jgi:hypothetical protein
MGMFLTPYILNVSFPGLNESVSGTRISENVTLGFTLS